MSKRITVVLIEQAYLIQAGIEKLLEEIPGMLIVKVFDGSERNLVEKTRTEKPHIIFINPRCIPENMIRTINELNNGDCLVVGLLGKNALPNVKSLFRHHVNIHDDKYELLEQLKSITGNIKLTERKSESAILSDREKTILKHVVCGLTAQEIAEKFFLSVHTVNTHRKNISNKLGIKTISGLTVYALMNKIVSMEEIDK